MPDNLEHHPVQEQSRLLVEIQFDLVALPARLTADVEVNRHFAKPSGRRAVACALLF